MDKSVLGSNIQKRRKRIGKTQEQIGDLVGVSKSQISKWEHGNPVPTVSNYMKLCEALNIRPEDLLDGNIERDLIENKEKKELWRKIISGTLCIIIVILFIRFFVRASEFSIYFNGEEHSKVLLSKQQLEDGSWEIRQMIRSNNDKVWADVLIHQQESKIIDCSVLELISADGDKIEYFSTNVNPLNEFTVHICYEEDGINKFTIIIVDSVKVN